MNSGVKVSRFSRQRGQSVAEFLVVAAVVVPMILTIASFANLLDVQLTASKAARFAGWERTVYIDKSRGGEWTTGEIRDHLKLNINELILSRPWNDFGPGKEFAANPTGLVDTITGVEFVTTELKKLTHDTDTQSVMATASGLGQSVVESAEISIPLNSSSSLLRIVEFVNYQEEKYTDLDEPLDSVANQHRFNLSERAPIVANGFAGDDFADALTEDGLKETVSKVALDGTPLQQFERGIVGIGDFNLGSGAIRYLGGFKEMSLGMGSDGVSTSAENQSRLLPSYLGAFNE
ncbi:hypothetical protein A9Q99_04355 [Gammaproteobacteria bacterium 45_16_T64]|nr:hypothetical protein A9Q99_04355 [Gammaproteobacteria bacterium 45_16_T64]